MLLNPDVTSMFVIGNIQLPRCLEHSINDIGFMGCYIIFRQCFADICWICPVIKADDSVVPGVNNVGLTFVFN